MPTAPQTAIQYGSKPLTDGDLNAPAKENASAIKAENPGKPRDAKNAIIINTVYLGINVPKPRKL